METIDGMAKSKKEPCLVFLLYMNRSGSTLLAQMLDRYREIGVTPEANIPDGLLLGKADIREHSDISAYLDKLYQDQKFCSWNVDRGKLEEALQRTTLPFGYEHILTEILNTYFPRAEASIRVYKRGHYITCVPGLRKLFPGCRFLFIERDPRAIFESQKRSIDSVTGRVMAVNPAERAIKYVRTMRLVKTYSKDEDFFVVRYEDLVVDPDRIIRSVLDFLEVGTRAVEQSHYFAKIPESQHHLHQGILGKPTVQKVDAWKKKLSQKEIAVIQLLAAPTLRSRGYELLRTHAGFWECGVYFLGTISHLLFCHLTAEVFRRLSKR
ncbi:sulfotransferase family protein [Desulfofustis limnaeus]|uniref:Sulfotransferase n=1 Tax=Desulfofustis limnaeus TaxID=2740163 RepID=A0ABM7WDX0_9BACT|nr:sulfotransferase [Desulfofustis limnaeus]BDD89157.1 hypothetical protein DPPLL_35220 [Desulfofustis limnaeus]